MATFSNLTKNSSTIANQAKGSASLIWDDADFAWNDGVGTWADPYSYDNQTKNTSTVTNETKN